jgi:copper chaperone
MDTLKFKTNIKCNNCVAKISQYLDESDNITEWKVDLENPDRILTVTGNDITGEYIKEILLKAGYKAEDIG